ncbi:hypothetical protein COCNU_scaffold001540G000020 [Cocos nucifera]|nr:hypothetical protein [Cocos nucifera]
MDGVQFIKATKTPRIASTDTSKAALGEARVSKALGTFGTASARVELHASTLDDYDLVYKAFSDFLYLANASKLLTKPLKMKRRKALDCLIRAAMLKTAKDKLSKVVGEASDRANVAEKKVQDAKVALKRFDKENAQLLVINKALKTEVEEFKARSTNAKESDAEALTMVKMAEEKMAMLLCDMEAQAEVTISRAILRAIDNSRH